LGDQCSYAVNGYLCSYQSSIKLAAIQSPASSIMTVEDISSWCFIGLTNWQTCFEGGPPTNSIMGHRHSDGMNMTFCDGHAKWYKTFVSPVYNPSAIVYTWQGITFLL
jgi:prepilin-type processing-associated H-X9-DG protein